MEPLRWSWLGRVPYRRAWALQEALRERVLAGDSGAERLLLLEHDPVVTLGRSADFRHVLLPQEDLAAQGVDVVRTSRGGDVTVHGPGQLVIYPVVQLRRGVLAHVEGVGRAIAEEMAARGVAAEWRREPTGVWVGDAKIAACGIHVRRRVAIHGYALNVTAGSLGLFSLIVPCGLQGTPVTSLATEAPAGAERMPGLEQLAETLAPRVARAFGREAQRESRETCFSMSIVSCDPIASR